MWKPIYQTEFLLDAFTISNAQSEIFKCREIESQEQIETLKKA